MWHHATVLQVESGANMISLRVRFQKFAKRVSLIFLFYFLFFQNAFVCPSHFRMASAHNVHKLVALQNKYAIFHIYTFICFPNT